MDEPKPWKRLSSEEGPDLLIGRVRYDLLENPRNARPMRRMVIETPDWVNVVAISPQREVVLVRQYRFGVAHVSVEIPGGVVDAGESPEEAARRELQEETGYTSRRWSSLGSIEPNPAFHDNLCHLWLAEEAEPTHEIEQDPGEDLSLELWPLDEVPRRIREGEMRHSLALVALSRVLDLRQR
jgi:8-oxo-dGTP pyrophosphatase MutT (NUDIX family)